LRAGAHGYLLKDMEPEDLCASLHKALSGKAVLSEAVMSSVVGSFSREDEKASSPSKAAIADLTGRGGRDFGVVG